MFKGHLSNLEREKQDKKHRKHDAVSHKSSLYDPISDQEMVDKVFGFLPSMIGGQEGQAPLGFEVNSNKEVIGQIHAWCNEMLEVKNILPTSTRKPEPSSGLPLLHFVREVAPG